MSTKARKAKSDSEESAKPEPGTRKTRRVVVPTGLHLLEEGGGRSLAVFACITVKDETIIGPEVHGVFLEDPTRAVSKALEAVCGYCLERHEFLSLLDALEEGDILPMDLTDANCTVCVDVPVIVAQVVRWLRTPKLRSLDRKAS